jgi:hypothetical protein
VGAYLHSHFGVAAAATPNSVGDPSASSVSQPVRSVDLAIDHRGGTPSHSPRPQRTQCTSGPLLGCGDASVDGQRAAQVRCDWASPTTADHHRPRGWIGEHHVQRPGLARSHLYLGLGTPRDHLAAEGLGPGRRRRHSPVSGAAPRPRNRHHPHRRAPARS